jgi:hypothetical protein
MKTISELFIHSDKGDTIEPGEVRKRDWLVQQFNNKTFSCITKTTDGNWKKVGEFVFQNDLFIFDNTLPKVLTKRKTFVSYYHYDDQGYI